MSTWLASFFVAGASPATVAPPSSLSEGFPGSQAPSSLEGEEENGGGRGERREEEEEARGGEETRRRARDHWLVLTRKELVAEAEEEGEFLLVNKREMMTGSMMISEGERDEDGDEDEDEEGEDEGEGERGEGGGEEGAQQGGGDEGLADGGDQSNYLIQAVEQSSFNMFSPLALALAPAGSLLTTSASSIPASHVASKAAKKAQKKKKKRHAKRH